MTEVCGTVILPNTPESLLSAGHAIAVFLDQFETEHGLGKVLYTAEAHAVVCAAKRRLIDAILACHHGYDELLTHGFRPGEQIGAST